MSIEDRVRAATRARADLVRAIRPLALPEDLLFSDDEPELSDDGTELSDDGAERALRLRSARQVRAWVIRLSCEDLPVLRRYQLRPFHSGFRHRR